MRPVKLGLVGLVIVVGGVLFMAAREIETSRRADASVPLSEPRVVKSDAPLPRDAPPSSDAPATKPIPRPVARLALEAPHLTPSLIGNCDGPPSPGEYLSLSSSVGYVVAGQSQLISAVSVIAAGSDGRAFPGLQRSWVIDGEGEVVWADRLPVPVVEPGAGSIDVGAWARTPGTSVVNSGTTSLKLGTTLMVRVVDELGNDVPGAAVMVENGDCKRSRGATITGEDATQAAFYHVDPVDKARVFVTAAGYFAGEMTLDQGNDRLVAGSVQGVEVAIKPRVDFAALGADFQSLIDGMLGQNTIAVLDLQSGRSVGVNADRQQYAGCTLKVFLMIAVAQDIEAGKYTKADVADLVYLAMGPSRVWPARALFEKVGAGDVGYGIRRVNRIIWDLGATSSIITHPPGFYWEEYGYLESDGVTENLVTANDFNLVLSKLWKGDVPLSVESREYVLGTMQLAPGFLSGVLGNVLPADVSLYHKMGQLDTYSGTWNDVGIVDFMGAYGKRYTYAISYLGSLSRWRDHYGYGQQLSRPAWAALSAAYGYQ